MFYVRKEAAAAIGNLAVVVDQQVVLDRLVLHFFHPFKLNRALIIVSLSFHCIKHFLVTQFGTFEGHV